MTETITYFNGSTETVAIGTVRSIRPFYRGTCDCGAESVEHVSRTDGSRMLCAEHAVSSIR